MAKVNVIANSKNERRNARRRERYQERKEEDPEYLTKESRRRKDLRYKTKTENPESYNLNLEIEKQKRWRLQRDIMEKIMDKLYEENKHTFPFPVSKSKWEKLKNEELDWMYVSNPLKIPLSDLSVHSLMNHRKLELSYIKKDPNHPCASSIIFYVKTMVHRPKDQRRLTEEERIWVKNFHLDSPEKPKKQKYVYDQTEYKREKRRNYYEKKKLTQKTANLNRRFMKADPNKVLSIDEITNNPYVSNFPIREQHKIDLWKADKDLSLLDLWKKQWENYVMEVEELSIEYKENFLKNKWQEQF